MHVCGFTKKGLENLEVNYISADQSDFTKAIHLNHTHCFVVSLVHCLGGASLIILHVKTSVWFWIQHMLDVVYLIRFMHVGHHQSAN